MIMDRTFAALANPTRRKILRMLRGRDMAAGEIAARFPMTAASVSHHLGVLKSARLVRAEREGRNVIYSLNTTVLHEFLEEMMELIGISREEDR